MRPAARAALAAAGLALAGCASMSEGTFEPSQQILLTSSPSGAEVWQGPRRLCATPCRVRRSELRYAEGYEFVFPDGRRVEAPPGFEGNGAIVGNIIAGGLIGTAIDAASGRAVARDGHVHIALEEQTP